MLDERGVEYFKHEDGEPLRKLEKADEPATSWHMGGASVCAVPIEGSDLFDLWIDHCTPEQAIAATLGRGTCRNVAVPDEYSDRPFTCSECGARGPMGEGTYHMARSVVMADGTHVFADSWPVWKYCPNCGRRVVP